MTKVAIPPLLANNFGCIPEGRFLRQASIDAGSDILTELDGPLTPADVDKLIAIPGTVELETTIARLIDRQEVKQAEMKKDSDELTGTLVSLNEKNEEVIETFQPRHVGRRITVAGAGPDGKTLVTDIKHVKDGKTIILAAKASQAVSGTQVILNRRNQVALDDYARRSVNSVTVKLKDRKITDARMIVGGRALVSETAGFSSEDLGTKVIIPAAGLLVTRIKKFIHSHKIVLVNQAQYTVIEGQADIWSKNDSRPCLEKLFDHLIEQNIKAAVIQFDAGIYDFTRMPDDSSPLNAAIGLFEKSNLTFKGAGPTMTALRLRPDQDLSAVTHMIEMIDCGQIVFQNLTILGSYLTMRKAGEQLHGITLNEGSHDIVIENVQVFQTGGDGIRFLGRAEHPEQNKPDNKVRNVTVKNCHLIQNKRSGFAIQRKVEQVTIQDCYIKMSPPSTDSCIDMEPTGNQDPDHISVSPTDILIDSCIMSHDTPAPAVGLSGFGGKDRAQGIKFINNKINGGHIYCSDIQDLTLQNNTVLIPSTGKVKRTPIYLGPSCENVLIDGNKLVSDHPASQSLILAEGVRKVVNVTVSNNDCSIQAGTGIQFLCGDGITIDSNKVVARGACKNGIKVVAQSADMDQVSVLHNQVHGEGTGRWEKGILLAAQAHCISHLTVDGNLISDADKEIVYLGKKFC
jgi:hypothetical protein